VQKDIIGELQKRRVELDSLRSQLEVAERDALLEKAAELKYGKIPESEKAIKELETQWKTIPEDERLLREEVTSDDIAQVVARWTGIPVSRLLTSEVEKLVHLEAELKKRVIGQDDAITYVANAIRRNRAGIGEENRPIGSFLFLGPTGVGKTETAKALATYLFDDEKAMTRIDMSEYTEPHSVARLIGAPPGYVGYEEGGQLTEAIRRKPYTVVLLDEVEKAHPQIFNVFLQIFDEGRLTDGRGRIVNFKNTIIIMTSNLGSELIMENIGKSDSEIKEKVMGVVKQAFRPEFINRLDQLVVYHALTPSLVSTIVDAQLILVKTRLASQHIELQFTQALKTYIAEVGYDPVYGVRPLKRAIQDFILDELALRLIEKKIVPGAAVKIDVKDGRVVFELPN